MIDIRKLKELVRLMVSHDLTEIDLRDAQEQVTLKRSNPEAATPTVVYAAPGAAAGAPVGSSGGESRGGTAGTGQAASQGGSPAGASAAADAGGASTEGLVEIASPMVGTFYSAASPEKPAFATVGTAVGPESVVCLIEAMKVFNEIKAECSGTIERVLVKNGEPVEFGQVIFLVRPS